MEQVMREVRLFGSHFTSGGQEGRISPSQADGGAWFPGDPEAVTAVAEGGAKRAGAGLLGPVPQVN